MISSPGRELAGLDELIERLGRDKVRSWVEANSASMLRHFPAGPGGDWLDEWFVGWRGRAADAALRFHWQDDPGLLIVWRTLDWDRRILGVPIAGIEEVLAAPGESPEHMAAGLGEFARTLREQELRLVIGKLPGDRVAVRLALEAMRFERLAIHFDYRMASRYAGGSAGAAPCTIEAAGEKDAEEVASLSARNHAPFDRYAIDRCVPRERVPEIYREWASNSLRGYADFVLVARVAGRIVGFGTWKRAPRPGAPGAPSIAHYGLGAVAEEERGRGIFRELTRAALVRLHELGIDWGSGCTNQLNVAAQRAFVALGGYPAASIFTYRLDLDSNHA